MNDLKISNCPICSIEKLTMMRKYRSNSELFSQSYLTRCNACDFVFTNPKPSEDDLLKYNSNYFISAHGGSDKKRDSEAYFESLSMIRYKYIEEYTKINFENPLKILEVGPGRGHLGKYILSKNKEISYDCVESDSTCHTNLVACGINIIEPKYIKRKYDLIIMSHVLEHISNPYIFLSNYSNLLNEDGFIFIEVPCQDWAHKIIDEPHLLFFDKKSLLFLFNKLNLKTVDIAYYGKSIDSLVRKSLRNIFLKLTVKLLIKLRLENFLPIFSNELDFLPTGLHRLIMLPVDAHIRSAQPSWWIRVILKRNIS